MFTPCSKFQMSVIFYIVLLVNVMISRAAVIMMSENILCRVSVMFVDIPGQPHNEASFICDAVFERAEEEWTLPVTYLLQPSKYLVQENQEALRNNEWYIRFPSTWLSEDRPTPTIIAPYGKEVTTVDPAYTERHLRKRSALRKQTRNRQTRETKPEETVLLVLVSAQNKALDVTPTGAKNLVFGSSEVSVASQFSACSFGELQLVPYDGDGVFEVTLDGDIGQYDRSSSRFGAKEKVCANYGLDVTCDPASDLGIDHVSYIVPFGLADDASTLGFALGGLGLTYTVFQGEAFSVAAIMHEYGHNYFLGHAGEGLDEYGDDTGQMGSSYVGSAASAKKRCFNGQNMWEMGWLKDRRHHADPTQPVTMELATFVDYDLTSDSQAVNIRIGDYYITYNIAKGMNEETREYKDEVIVVQKVPDERPWMNGFFDTDLVASLNHYSRTTFTVENYNGGSDPLVIRICDKVSGPPDYVVIAFGLNAVCDEVVSLQPAPMASEQTSSPTRAPTKSPVLSATPVPTRSPTQTPTKSPVAPATPVPTRPPTKAPTQTPTKSPVAPAIPVPTRPPTKAPIVSPTSAPTATPTTDAPSPRPSLTVSSSQPSTSPSISFAPTLSPAPSLAPSAVPSSVPTLTAVPTISFAPSLAPSQKPSSVPTRSVQPSSRPSTEPSSTPTTSVAPSSTPTDSHAPTESIAPSGMPSVAPSDAPTVSMAPSQLPSMSPSDAPSISIQPSLEPSAKPSSTPTTSAAPSSFPTTSHAPSVSIAPSALPSMSPSDAPSISMQPSKAPSSTPSAFPTISAMPTVSARPSSIPSNQPSSVPTVSAAPSVPPSNAPSTVET